MSRFDLERAREEADEKSVKDLVAMCGVETAHSLSCPGYKEKSKELRLLNKSGVKCCGYDRSILITHEEYVSVFLIFWYSFICQNVGLNRKGQIVCTFEIAFLQMQLSQSNLAGFDQIRLTG